VKAVCAPAGLGTGAGPLLTARSRPSGSMPLNGALGSLTVFAVATTSGPMCLRSYPSVEFPADSGAPDHTSNAPAIRVERAAYSTPVELDESVESGTVTPAIDPKGGVGFTVLASGLLQGNHYIELHSGGSCAPGKVNGRTTAAGAAGHLYAPKGAKVVQSDNSRAFTGRLPDIAIGADGAGNVAGSVLGISMSQLAGRTIQGQGNNTLDPLAPMATQRGRLACDPAQVVSRRHWTGDKGPRSGAGLEESGRPGSNRRRPAWESDPGRVRRSRSSWVNYRYSGGFRGLRFRRFSFRFGRFERSTGTRTGTGSPPCPELKPCPG